MKINSANLSILCSYFFCYFKEIFSLNGIEIVIFKNHEKRREGGKFKFTFANFNKVMKKI